MSIRRPCARGNSAAGFSAAEVTTILVALTILSGVSAPAIHDYIEDARSIRANHDVATIAVSLVRLINDVGFERSLPRGWAAYDLLVGAGNVPAAAGDASAPWAAPLPGHDEAGAAAVGALDDQLMNNAAAYRRYRARAMIGWRGPYLQQAVSADPWGHRYAVNVRSLRTSDSDTFVVSAGPDGRVAMPFDTDGLHGGTDDLAALVASSGIDQ